MNHVAVDTVEAILARLREEAARGDHRSTLVLTVLVEADTHLTADALLLP